MEEGGGAGHHRHDQEKAMNDTSDWQSHRMLVMDKLNTVHDDLESLRLELGDMRTDLGRLREEVSVLKLRVAVWSAAIATIGTSAIHFVIGRIK